MAYLREKRIVVRDRVFFLVYFVLATQACRVYVGALQRLLALVKLLPLQERSEFVVEARLPKRLSLDR